MGRAGAAGGLYHYSPDRRADHPLRHLAGFRGILQALACSICAGVIKSGHLVAILDGVRNDDV